MAILSYAAWKKLFKDPSYDKYSTIYVGNPKIKPFRNHILYLKDDGDGKFEIIYSTKADTQSPEKLTSKTFSVPEIIKWLTRKDTPMTHPDDKVDNAPLGISDIKQRLLLAKGDDVLKLKSAKDSDKLLF